MIKSLKKLERNLGFKLKSNVFCLAIDTATKSGIAMIDITNGKLLVKTYLLTLPKLSKDSESKAEKYQEHLSEFVKLIDKELIPSLPKFSKDKSISSFSNLLSSKSISRFIFASSD